MLEMLVVYKKHVSLLLHFDALDAALGWLSPLLLSVRGVRTPGGPG
jgi:hypothetical protein